MAVSRCFAACWPMLYFSYRRAVWAVCGAWGSCWDLHAPCGFGSAGPGTRHRWAGPGLGFHPGLAVVPSFGLLARIGVWSWCFWRRRGAWISAWPMGVGAAWGMAVRSFHIGSAGAGGGPAGMGLQAGGFRSSKRNRPIDYRSKWYLRPDHSKSVGVEALVPSLLGNS